MLKNEKLTKKTPANRRGRRKKSAYGDDFYFDQELEFSEIDSHNDIQMNFILEEIESQFDSVDEEEPRRPKNVVDGLVGDVDAEAAEWVGVHPAEIAAAAAKKNKAERVSGGSDEEILKDLRKYVFSVPLMQQDSVEKMFAALDHILNPAAFKILEVSDYFYESVFQSVLRVIGGNTYGKNIYEKPMGNDSAKDIYKAHEVVFLKNSYLAIRAFVDVHGNPGAARSKIKPSLEKCQFIRGIYEDVVMEFELNLGKYADIHQKSHELGAQNKFEELTRNLDLINELDRKYRLVRPAYGISRDIHVILRQYTDLRAKIIAPYLRAVYSAAKSTAKNAHQMLDNFQNGTIGLMKAISCYYTSRGSIFASVAKWWIMQMMLLSIKEDSNFVKLPISTWQAYTQLERAKSKVLNEDDLNEVAKAARMPVKKAESVYHAVKIAQVYSLNKTYDADERMTLEDVITDDSAEYLNSLEEILREYCSKANLSPEEKQVVALRFGMPDLISSACEVPPDAILQETLVQNLAKIGYHFKKINS